MLKALALCLLFPLVVVAQQGPSYELQSPNGRIRVQIKTGEQVSYDLTVNGKPVLQNAALSIDIDHHRLGKQSSVKTTKTNSVSRDIISPVPQKSVKISENYKELRLEMEGNYSVVFRAFDEGVAYRIETQLPQPAVKVYDEEMTLNFTGNPKVYYPKEESFFSHNEREFVYMNLKDISNTLLASVPAVVEMADGLKVVVAESDVEDYPGLWFRGNSSSTLSATFPRYPLKEELKGDRDLRVSEAADYIAATKGTRTFPWRILGIAEKDGDIISNQMVYLLAKPSQVTDTSWIKPGKVAWDWYNANNIYGVDFKAGVNTQTYKYYIDFASKYGIQYIILDEGWYKLGNVLDVVPEMNIEELVAYGKQKNVGIVLWLVWKTFDNQFDAAMAQYEKWGIKGLKIDFMQRDDQPVMNFYEKVCREAAKRKMLVDFHGAVRPALLTRTWPNLVNTEGVRGLEQNKWSKLSNPEHNVTIPFTRMFLGPMDYTPGAMINSGAERNFAAIFERPMSMGTRCQQLAMYVVYEAPLQMLADSPSHYLLEPDLMHDFFAPVPTVWDESHVLAAKMGDYVAVARRHSNDWWVGALNDWTPREIEIDFSFLPPGNYQVLSYEDGENAARSGNDYKRTSTVVNKSIKLKIKLAGGGGWAARLYRMV